MYLAPLRRVVALLVLLAGLALAAIAQAFTPPPLGSYVTDVGGRIDPGTRVALDVHLRQIQETTGRQIVFLVLDTLGDESIDDVAFATAKSWHVGRAGKDDGVVVVLALTDRKIRIEVGKGVEDRLPDLKCSDIIRATIAPALRRGDIEEGIRRGADAISEALGNDAPTRLPSKSDPDPMIFIWILLGGIAFFVGIILYGRWKQNQWGDPRAARNRSRDDGVEISWLDSSPSSGGGSDSGGSSVDTDCSGGGGDFGGGGASGDF